MSIYYHGTNSEKEILENGLKILDVEVNGKHFGKGLYFTPSEAIAYDYGEKVITVDINDELLLELNGMDDYNTLEFKSLFKGGVKEYLRQNGYNGFNLKQIDGNYVVVVFNESIIRIIERD